MSVRPFGESGVLTVNSRVQEVPHRDEGQDSEASCVDQNGIVTTCSHSWRTQNVRHMEHWDWVPGFLGDDRRITHGLCPVCVNYHYGLSLK
jgi:hypothetical protein